jgi:hypothetical protein
MDTRTPKLKAEKFSSKGVKFSTAASALYNEPDFMLQAMLEAFLEEANPVYLWKAIKICGTHNRPLPPWILAYLFAVADRMTSKKARQAPDLREVLPSLLGFPKKKRGPGRMLDPGPDPNRSLFASAFAVEIARGREPSEAFAAAATCKALDPASVGKEEKTMWGWLMAEFELTDRPKTNAEWRTAIDAIYRPIFESVFKSFEEIVSRNHAVT